jgi:hypothetical protein
MPEEVLGAPRVITGQGTVADLLGVGVTTARDLGGRGYLGRLRRVIARGRDYVPDSGRFDVSAPGTPFADPDHPVGLRLITAATRRRQV